ncbi:hypothetical protein V8F20_007833 [Naviculisporaceae sp. PSN 640]
MAQDDSVVVISSSPDFPSIHQLLAKSKSPKRSTLRSGKHAAPIPDDAPSTFTTAASLWKALHPSKTLDEDESVDTNVEEDAAAKSDGTKKSTETAVKEGEDGGKKPRKKRATTSKSTKKSKELELEEVDAPLVGPAPEEALPAPKKRGRPKAATKSKEDTQTTIPKGKVTKAAPKEKKARKKTETVSRHFANPAPPTEPVTSLTDDEPMAIEQAMRRRMDWTPPPENIVIDLEDSVLSQEPAHEGAFKNLLDGYNHKIDDNQVTSAADSGQANGDILGKRKLIELVATTTSKTATPEVSPSKSKAPKKKPRTITELAMAAYRAAEEDGEVTTTESARKESLLDYFDPDSIHAENGKEMGKTAKATKKPTKAKASKKKAEPRKQILLSPASALKAVSGQDFVFGTASQLATEDDPDLLRALHEAMKASNCPDSDPFASSPIPSELAGRRRLGNKLWTAGARGDDGDLLDIEVLDLTESPAPDRDHLLSQVPVANQSKKAQEQAISTKIQVEVLSSDFDTFDLTDSPAVPPVRKSHIFPTQGTATTGAGKIAESTLARPLTPPERVQPNSVIDLDFEPPPSNQEQSQLIAQSQAQASPAKSQAIDMPPRPKFELYTDARLAKEISSYGFKPVKKRETMIALLEQCWENKQKAAAVLKPSTDGAVSKTKTTGRPRGRPRKASRDAADLPEPTSLPAVTTPKRSKAARPKEEIVEIPDSDASDEEDPFASSPLSLEQKDEVFSDDAHEAMDVSLSDDTEDASLLATEGPTTEQALLFNRITRAVMTAPRTTDPENPSWYEKMLMYDPVILEDLTMWLNQGQLDRVGYDGEVNPEEVKLWCHSKSICCLWKVNIHGKARKRF